jgi:indolepyruvate decarboxylase
VYEAVNAFLNTDNVISADNGETLIAGVDIMTRADDGFFAPGFYTSVGYSVPTAMGVQLARPDVRPVVLVGDAAFQMDGVEVSTMHRYGLNPIVIVMNNGGYGSERPMFDGQFVDVQRWNYYEIPKVVNAGKGLHATTEDELAEALEEARAMTESFVIVDVHMEKFDYSPSFSKFLELFAAGAK